MNRRTRVALAAILALGLLVRLAHLAAIARSSFPEFPLVFTESDMHAFWQWAGRIVAGDWLGRDTYHPYMEWMERIAPRETWNRLWGGKEVFHQAPLYPYFVALLLRIVPSPTFVLGAQLVLGCLQPLVLFALARRLFGPREGLVAAGIGALYGPLVFEQGVLSRDWLPPLTEPLLLAAVLRAKERDGAWAWLMAGGAMALAVLVKETALLLAALILGWLTLQFRPRWRAALRPLALVGAGFLLCLLPLFGRNLAVGAPLFRVSGQGVPSLVVGFVADARTAGFGRPSDQAIEIVDRTGGALWPTLREVLTTHRPDLGGLARQQLAKLRALTDPLELPNNTSYGYGGEISPALRLTLSYGVVFPLGLGGWALLARRWRRHAAFFCYLFASVGAQLFKFSVGRFRLAFVPVLILGAAVLAVASWRALRERRWGRAAALGAVVAAGSFLQHAAAPAGGAARVLRPNDHVLAAHLYAERGDHDRALAEIERFRARARRLGATPEHLQLAAVRAGDLHLKWADALLAANEAEEARRHLRRAEAEYAEVPQLSYPYFALGKMQWRLGELERARTWLQAFLAREPRGERADEARELLSD